MSKIYNKRIFSPKDIDWNDYNIYKINNDKTIIFRCKYCRMCRLKKDKLKILKISGHKANCSAVFKKKIQQKKI